LRKSGGKLGRQGLAAARRFRAWTVLVAAVVWGLFVLWEWAARGSNIRIDALLIYPLLVALTLWGLIAGTRTKESLLD
jgi:hypothetical protein